MANCTISNPPVFNENIVKWDKQTDADGDAMGAVIEQLLNNTAYNRQTIARALGSISATLTVAGWTGSGPYTQQVNAAGIKAEDIPIIGLEIPDGADASIVKAHKKAWSCVERAVTGNGTLTFYCYNKKPISDFMVQVKGVSG